MLIQMSFNELFDHLALYIRDPDQRWKHVVRVKCDLEDFSMYGGRGQDQVYFSSKEEKGMKPFNKLLFVTNSHMRNNKQSTFVEAGLEPPVL